MADNIQIPDELQRKLEESILTDFKEHTTELRRSFEISTTFYEKLATLNAASIAVAASAGVGLAVKLGLNSASLHRMLNWLVPISVLLWISLICAIAHNFAAASVARLEASYSHEDFIRKIIRKSLEVAKQVSPEIDGTVFTQIENAAHQEPLKKQKKLVAWNERIKYISPYLGYISIISFLLAYTLVVICIVVVECRY